MKKLALAFALLTSVAAFAQTFEQTPGEHTCRIATYECQNILLTSGDSYTFNGPYSVLLPGTQFVFDTTQGAITQVLQAPPSFSPGTYPLSFNFELANGKTGNVTGTIVIVKPGRWPYAAVENSDLTLNQ